MTVLTRLFTGYVETVIRDLSFFSWNAGHQH
jgi:hypothetical protein